MEKQWIPRDGDAFLTRDNFIFYTFGYEHPANRVFSFIKYIPSRYRSLFSIKYLPTRWKKGATELVRPKKLYSVSNFQRFVEVFRSKFPDYIYVCPYRERELLCPAKNTIKIIYVPSQRLQELLRKKTRNRLQDLTLELVNLFSNTSNIPIEDFGVHGSVAVGMETDQSDIDLVVYGAENFRKLETAVSKLADEGILNYLFSNELDVARKQHGKFRGKAFVYTAVRKIDEISAEYGDYKYSVISPVMFRCKVIDDREAMFRPAIYKISNCEPLDEASQLESQHLPDAVVSMIGMHRNIARKGDYIEVSGVLEQVENMHTGRISFQAVVGSGSREDEYIHPFQMRK